MDRRVVLKWLARAGLVALPTLQGCGPANAAKVPTKLSTTRLTQLSGDSDPEGLFHYQGTAMQSTEFSLSYVHRLVNDRKT
jgi:hypothetical protein